MSWKDPYHIFALCVMGMPFLQKRLRVRDLTSDGRADRSGVVIKQF